MTFWTFLFCFVALTLGSVEDSVAGEWLVQFSGLGTPVEATEFDEGAEEKQNPEILCNLTTAGATFGGKLVSPDHGLNLGVSVQWVEKNIGEVHIRTIEKATEESLDSDAFGEEIEGPPALLFRFQLANRTNGFLIAEGEFLGTASIPAGTYQFTIPNSNSFVLTIFTKNSGVVVISGHRKPVPAELTFWQKWGTPIMVAGFMLMQTFLKPKQQIPGQPTGEEPRQRREARPEDKQD